MNLLEKAKVITTPTAYSDGILHSVKPNVLENLLLQSNQFDTTWTKNNITLTSGQSGYDGSSDAWLLDTTIANGYLRQEVIFSGVSTFSVYAKAGTADGIYIAFAASTFPNLKVDLSSQSFISSTNIIDYNIEDVGNGWSRVSFTISGSHIRVNIKAVDNSGSVIDGTIYIQDAQLNKGYSADQYIETTTETSPRADFTFTRNSSATRVGEDGYIQDVQIIGGELVQNGDFEEIGSELVTNGDFSDGTNNWENPTYGADNSAEFSVLDGALKIEKTADLDWRSSFARQYPISYTNGKIYRVKYSLKDGNTSGADVYIRSKFSNSGNTINIRVLTSDWVEYTDYYVADSNSEDISFGVLDWQNTGTGQYYFVDNVSVKEVGQNWTFQTGWSIADVNNSQVAQFDGGADSAIQQGSLLTNGIKYRLSLDVGNKTTGSLQIRFGNTGVVDETITTNGTFTYDLVSDGTTLYLRSIGGFDGYIDNISVKEVTDDTNLPRINYEGFSYEETLGDEEVVNGTFDTDSDWSKGTGWSISGGKAVSDGTTGNLDQNNVLTIGNSYKAEFTVTDLTTGALSFRLGGTNEIINVNANGTYIAYGVADGVVLRLRSQSGFDGSIDNVSVKEVIGDLPIYGSGKGHFLLEGQGTNLFLYSEYINASVSSWSSFFDTIITNNDAISPEGVNNATKIACPIGGAARLDAIVSSLAAGTYTYSFYAKGDVTNLDINVYQDATGTTLSTTAIETLINGSQWSRVTITFTSTALSTIRFIHLNMTAGEYFHLWGVMLEQNSYATSYIPTNGSAVTRAAETCNNAGNADLFDSEGVLYADIAALANDGTYREIALSDGTSNNRIEIRYTTADNQIQFIVRSGGSALFLPLYNLDDALEFKKFAIRYKDDDFSAWVDGVQVSTGTSGTAPTGLSELSFDDGSGSNDFYGKTKMVGVFPYLSNDEMECLTGEGYGTFQAMALANNYTVI